MADKKAKKIKKIKRIRSGFFGRGVSLSKMALGSGARLAGHKLRHAFSDDAARDQEFEKLLAMQAERIVSELGHLKGTLMKVGQLIAVLGENQLPPRVVDAFKSLQADSSSLPWKQVRKILNRRMGVDWPDKLIVEEEAFAAASIGQVHRATIKDTGEQICLKIQYPGVEKAISSDIKALRSILKMFKFVGSDESRLDEILREVQLMMRREMDYLQEAATTQRFYDFLQNDQAFMVPRVYHEFCSKKILATQYLSGVSFQHETVQELSLDRRNAMAENLLRITWAEIFELNDLQTDTHFGNYLVQIDPDGEQDRIILLDFGAMRKFSKDFRKATSMMINACLDWNETALEQGLRWHRVILPGDSEEIIKAYLESVWICMEMVRAPEDTEADNWEGDIYVFEKSTLLERNHKANIEIIKMTNFRGAPGEYIFLGRKLAGLYGIICKLKPRINLRKLIEFHQQNIT